MQLITQIVTWKLSLHLRGLYLITSACMKNYSPRTSPKRRYKNWRKTIQKEFLGYLCGSKSHANFELGFSLQLTPPKKPSKYKIVPCKCQIWRWLLAFKEQQNPWELQCWHSAPKASSSAESTSNRICPSEPWIEHHAEAVLQSDAALDSGSEPIPVGVIFRIGKALLGRIDLGGLRRIKEMETESIDCTNKRK